MAKRQRIIKLGKLSTHYLNEDKFSKLTDDLLINILSLLTTKEAVKTSILSSRWKNLWKSVCKIEIEMSDLVCLRASRSKCLADLKKLFSAMKTSKISVLHVNEIPHLSRETKKAMMDLIVRFSKAHHVEDLVLNYGISMDDSIFQGVYGIKSLVRLQLQSCCENISHRIETLPLLKTLLLSKMTIVGKKVEELISHSPLLESLDISISGHCTINHVNLRSLRIIDRSLDGSAVWTLITPALKFLQCKGWDRNKGYVFENISTLTMCEFHGWDSYYANCPKIKQLWDYLMNDLRFVKTICFNKHIMQGLIGSPPKEGRLMNTSLILNLSWVCSRDVNTLAQVLYFFPKLEKLEIKIAEENDLYGAIQSDVWKTLTQSFSELQELQEVDIHGFISTSLIPAIRPSETKLKLVEVLLENLQSLEKLRIHVRREMTLLDDDVQLQFLDLFQRLRCLTRADAKLDLH